MSDRADWLAGLKRGDEVIVSGKIERVLGLTKTQIILEDGVRYRRTNGCLVGLPNAPALEEPTTARRTEIRRRELTEFVRYRVKWHDEPLAVLEAVMALVTEGSKSRLAVEAGKGDAMKMSPEELADTPHHQESETPAQRTGVGPGDAISGEVG